MWQQVSGTNVETNHIPIVPNTVTVTVTVIVIVIVTDTDTIALAPPTNTTLIQLGNTHNATTLTKRFRCQ